MSARAHVESLLRAKHLDRTLAPAWEVEAAVPTVALGIDSLDHVLGGGLPRGQVSEVVGPRSSGRAGLVCALLASTTQRGDLAALVDVADGFDPEYAHGAGVVLSRVLWVRGRAGVAAQVPARHPARRSSSRAWYRYAPWGGRPLLSDTPQWGHVTRAGEQAATAAADLMGVAIDRAVKAMQVLLQSGVFAVVVLDCADIAPLSMQRLPFTTWRRLQRAVEGSAVVGVVLAPRAGTRSAGGVTLSLGPSRSRVRWKGRSDRARLFDGLDLRVEIGRARVGSTGSGVAWQLRGLHV